MIEFRQLSEEQENEIEEELGIMDNAEPHHVAEYLTKMYEIDRPGADALVEKYKDEIIGLAKSGSKIYYIAEVLVEKDAMEKEG